MDIWSVMLSGDLEHFGSFRHTFLYPGNPAESSQAPACVLVVLPYPQVSSPNPQSPWGTSVVSSMALQRLAPVMPSMLKARLANPLHLTKRGYNFLSTHCDDSYPSSAYLALFLSLAPSMWSSSSRRTIYFDFAEVNTKWELWLFPKVHSQLPIFGCC